MRFRTSSTNLLFQQRRKQLELVLASRRVSSLSPCLRRQIVTATSATRQRILPFTSTPTTTSSTTIKLAIAPFSTSPPAVPPNHNSSAVVPSSSSSSQQQQQQQQTEDSNLPTTPAVESYLPIDFKTSSKIEGEESQVAIIKLKPGECLRAESGAMLFMTSHIEMNTHLAGASSAFTRMLTGQNVFLTDFTCKQPEKGETGGVSQSSSSSSAADTGEGEVGLGTDFPSKILRLSLSDLPNQNLICQRGAFLASNPTVNIEMEFTKSLSAGFFGGQGFVLQKLTITDPSHDNDVLIKAGGTVVVRQLEEGESLRVSSGSIVAFESTVDYDIQMMPGIKNVMFGGEGLFVTKLTGPGRVWMQGMPPDRMIAEIASRVPRGLPIGFGIPLGGGGGGDAAAGAAAAGGADEAAAAGDPSSLDATDAAINADRQAAVATSGMGGAGADTTVDPDSSEALFGDALPEDSIPKTPDSSSADTMGSETSFQDDGFSTTTTTEEPSFDDTSFSSSSSSNDNFGSEGDGFEDGELFDDTSSGGGGGDAGGGDGAEEGGSSILSTLWDLFTGGDD